MSFDDAEIQYVDLAVDLDNHARFEGARAALCSCGHRFDAHRTLTYGNKEKQFTKRPCDHAGCPCDTIRTPKTETTKAIIIGGRR